jgi:hypothetical protein
MVAYALDGFWQSKSEEQVPFWRHDPAEQNWASEQSWSPEQAVVSF